MKKPVINDVVVQFVEHGFKFTSLVSQEALMLYMLVN